MLGGWKSGSYTPADEVEVNLAVYGLEFGFTST
jgi:hypothetical protein